MTRYRPPTPMQSGYEGLVRKDRYSPVTDPFEDLPADMRALLIRAVNAHKRHRAYLDAAAREYDQMRRFMWVLHSHGVGVGRVALALGVSRRRAQQILAGLRDEYEPRKARAKAGKVVRPDAPPGSTSARPRLPRHEPPLES